MPGISVVPDIIDNFMAQLQVRPVLSGVTVTSTPPADTDELKAEGVAIGGAEVTQDWASMRGPTPRMKENITLRGQVWAAKDGAGEDVATTARVRAYELLAEVQAQVYADPTFNNAYPSGGLPGKVSRHVLTPGVGDGTRWSRIEWEITISDARLAT